MNIDNMTLEERERFHFANGDVSSAWLIRETEDCTIDSVEHDHEKALQAAQEDGYAEGVADTTPDAMREKLEALEIELINLKRVYNMANAVITSADADIRDGLCKNFSGRVNLLADLRGALRYLPKQYK